MRRIVLLSISIPTTISIQRGEVSEEGGAMGQVFECWRRFDPSEQGGRMSHEDEAGAILAVTAVDLGQQLVQAPPRLSLF